MKFLHFLAFLLSCVIVHDVASAQAGSARSLLFQPSPVVNAMGGAGVALLHNSFEQYNNPGALGFGSSFDVTVSKQETRPESYQTPQYYVHISGGWDSVMHYGFAANMIERGTVYPVYENGVWLGTFRGSDICISVSAARRFGTDLSCGLSVGYFSTALAPTTFSIIGVNQPAVSSRSVTISFGALLKNVAPGSTLVNDMESRENRRSTPYNQGTAVEPGICLGVCLSNVGTAVQIGSETSSLPLSIRMGGTYTALRKRDLRALVAVDLDSRPLDGQICDYLRAGINLQLWRILSLRAGYAVSLTGNLNSYHSLGVGLQYGFFHFNVAWYATGIVPTASIAPTMSWE